MSWSDETCFLSQQVDIWSHVHHMSHLIWWIWKLNHSNWASWTIREVVAVMTIYSRSVPPTHTLSIVHVPVWVRSNKKEVFVDDSCISLHSLHLKSIKWQWQVFLIGLSKILMHQMQHTMKKVLKVSRWNEWRILKPKLSSNYGINVLTILLIIVLHTNF